MTVAADWFASTFEALPPEAAALRDGFLRWQCRVRQIAMREAQGRPDDAIMPVLRFADDNEPLGQIVTVMCRKPEFSVLPEMQHMARATFDPTQRRDKALTFFSAAYYQKYQEFSDTLTATFQPGSKGAEQILEKRECVLTFAAFNQRFDISVRASGLGDKNHLYQATWWHNRLFNPNLAPQTIVLGFVPDWQESRADPAIPFKK